MTCSKRLLEPRCSPLISAKVPAVWFYNDLTTRTCDTLRLRFPAQRSVVSRLGVTQRMRFLVQANCQPVAHQWFLHCIMHYWRLDGCCSGLILFVFFGPVTVFAYYSLAVPNVSIFSRSTFFMSCLYLISFFFPAFSCTCKTGYPSLVSSPSIAPVTPFYFPFSSCSICVSFQALFNALCLLP